MISHVTLGTRNLTQAEDFYNALLRPVGGRLLHKSDTVMFYEFSGHETKLAITLPFDGQAASAGNGTMLALKLDTIEQVEHLYQLAMSMGAMCEGKPGPRNEGAYTGAYIRDLDGNKIALFHRPK